MPVPALTGWAMVLGGTVHVVLAVGIGESIANIQVTPLSVAMVLYLSVFIGAVGLVMYLVLMGEVGLLKANMTTYLTPIVAIAIGTIASCGRELLQGLPDIPVDRITHIMKNRTPVKISSFDIVTDERGTYA